MRFDTTTAVCDRCDKRMETSRSEAPQSFHRAGWVTLSRSALGTNSEHTTHRSWELCPQCADAFSDFLLVSS